MYSMTSAKSPRWLPGGVKFSLHMKTSGDFLQVIWSHEGFKKIVLDFHTTFHKGCSFWFQMSHKGTALLWQQQKLSLSSLNSDLSSHVEYDIRAIQREGIYFKGLNDTRDEKWGAICYWSHLSSEQECRGNSWLLISLRVINLHFHLTPLATGAGKQSRTMRPKQGTRSVTKGQSGLFTEDTAVSKC